MRFSLFLNHSALALSLSIATSMFSNAQARVYEYTFTDINGAQKSVPESAPYLNPHGNFNALLIGGLDQQIRLTVTRDADNSAVYSTTTSIISVDDRISSANGNMFYGKTVTIPPISDGRYTIKSEILDSKSTVVSTTSHPFIIDTVGPTSDNFSVPWIPGYNMVVTGPRWELGQGQESAINLAIKNINDLSGFDKAIVQIIKPDGSIQSSYTMAYDDGSRAATAPITKGGGAIAKATWMPVSDADVEFRFRAFLYDKAGNVTQVPDQKFVFDSSAGEYELFAVADPNSSTSVVPGISSGYIKYSAGMTVNTNPVTLVYKIPKHNYRAYNKAGLSFGSLLTEDNSYVYIKQSTPVGTSFTIHNGYQYGGGNASYNVKLSSIAPKSPAIKSYSANFSTIGDFSAGTMKFTNIDLPGEYQSITVFVDPRDYVQSFYNLTQGYEVCTIEPGESSCTGPFSYAINKGNGYIAHYFIVRNQDKTLTSNQFEIRSIWNTDLIPKITGYDYKEENKSVLVYVTQPGNGNWRDVLMLSKLEILDTISNTVLLTGTKAAMSGEDYTYAFDLSAIPEGKYDLTFRATDTFNNSSQLPFRSLIIDNSPPSISFSYEGKPLLSESTVYGLENISVAVSDALSKSKISQMVLQGGPASDDVELGFTHNTDGSYTPLYPRLFPSLDEKTDKYTLVVKAIDDAGNESSKSIRFAYYPKNLIVLDKLNTLAVNKPLNLSSGEPLAVLKASQLRRNDGSLAKGVQTALITVRGDSAFPISVIGNLVSPGETKEIQIDLGSVGNDVVVPIFPGVSGVVGASGFIVEFPQLK
ncbi:TPA: Ig-like domain repeat protein [Klebsiella pneumoniae]|nr:Ig-like domain repeat protein [Klebsiella pneumoniae]